MASLVGVVSSDKKNGLLMSYGTAVIIIERSLQNALNFITKHCSFLLQNAAKFDYKTRRPIYHKALLFYCKLRQLLQNTLVLLRNAAGNAKCVDYYKTRHNKPNKFRFT